MRERGIPQNGEPGAGKKNAASRRGASGLQIRPRLPRVSERRRTSLTPLDSELRFPDVDQPRAPSAWQQVRRRLRRKRQPPKTVFGALVAGVVRLGIVAGLASLLALLIGHSFNRTPALGFYIVGGALLAVAMGLSGGTGRRYYTDQFDRERRVSASLSYILAGLVVIAIGVAIEAAR